MNTSDVLGPLYGPITAIQRLIEQFNDQGIIIGGVAVSILGEPRLTADADAMLLLSIEQIPRLIEVAAKEGLAPRLEDVEGFARKNRVLWLLGSTVCRTA